MTTEWTRCRDCKRPLRSKGARVLGYGRDCARRRGLTPTRRTPGRRPKPAKVAPAADALPGQDAIPLFYFEPTLDSL